MPELTIPLGAQWDTHTKGKGVPVGREVLRFVLGCQEIRYLFNESTLTRQGGKRLVRKIVCLVLATNY